MLYPAAFRNREPGHSRRFPAVSLVPSQQTAGEHRCSASLSSSSGSRPTSSSGHIPPSSGSSKTPSWGRCETSIAEPLRHNLLFLVLRFTTAAVLVPILEELFWRGWMMRWLINPRFSQGPAWARTRPLSFWIGRAALRLRARAVLGSRPDRRDSLQLVDDPDQEPGRLHPRPRRNQCNFVRIRPVDRSVAILAITGLTPRTSHMKDRYQKSFPSPCRGSGTRLVGPRVPEPLVIPP